MSINFGEFGSFNKILDLYLKENGGWVSVEQVYYKEDGSWVKVYPEDVGKTVDPLILWSIREEESGTDDLTDAARPLNLQAAFTSNGVDLSWEVFNPDLVDKYEIHRSDAPDGTFTKVGESVSKQFVDTSIPKGTYKFYKVRSVLLSSGSFSEFSKPEYGHLVDIEIDSTDISYSSPALTTVEGNLSSFGQAELALPAAKWKESSDSNYQEKKSGDPKANGSGSISVDLKVKYSNTPTSSLYVDNPGVNDGNDSSSFDKIVTNGNYIVTKTEQAVRLWDFSYNLKDTITYPDETSDPGSNAIKDVAIRDDGYVGVAKRNDAGDSNAIELYEIDGNENLTSILEDSRPGGFSDSNYGYSVTFRQSNGVMAVGNVDGEIFYYDSSSDKVEKRDYSSASSSLNEFYRLGYREYDGMLYAIRRQSGTRDSLLIIDSSRNVVEEALGSTIAVADWNNFDGPNAGYLVGMDKATETFHVWDDTLTKVGNYEVHPDGYTDHYPTSVHWRPDGGLLFTLDNGGFFATHDSGFNLIQRAFTQNKADGSADSAPLTDGMVLSNNKIFVSYDFTASDSPSANSDLRMLSSFEIGPELIYETNYDVTLGLRNDQTFYPANTDNTFDTNIPIGPDTSPSNVTFESFEVEASQEKKTIDLSWIVSDGRVPDSYNIYRAGTQNGNYTQIANVADGNSYSDSPGIGEYFYFVRIVESGVEYNQSATKSAELRVTSEMYFLDRNGASFDSFVRQFRLTDVWDLDEASYTQEINLDYAVSADAGFVLPPSTASTSNSLVSAQSLSFKNDGTRLFILRDSEAKSAGVWQLTLGDPYQLSSWERGTSEFFDMESQLSFPNGMHFKPDGGRVFVSQRDAMDIYQYQLGTSWDITTASFVQSVTLDDPNQSGEALSGEIEFKPDGTKLFATLDSGDIAEFALSTAWDITTAGFQDKAEISDGSDGIYFTGDGSRFYAMTPDGTVTENIMKTKWDVTTKVEMNSAEYIDTNNEEQVDLNFHPPEDNFDVPQNVQASGDFTSGEITISWNTNSSSSIDHYNVYSADSSGGSFTQINSSNVNDIYFADSNVTEGKDYFYKVSSVVNGSETQLSDEVVGNITPPTIFYDGFESGVTKWTTDYEFERKSDAAYAGSYSAGRDEYYYADPDDAVASISPTQIDEISWYWQEDSNQYGSSLSLYNSNGNRELAIGTENPQWTFWDGTGYDEDIYDPGVYDTWMYVKLHNFDWANGTYDYHYENTNSGHVETGTRSMNHAVDISEIWLGTKPDDSSTRLFSRWDEVEVLKF